ncbi:hypothetical protein BCT47_14095 [Vibrio splendidus]|uniref:AbrB/MazE/SpoVT family DNA-binding domain-containing protein n=1 Tax=Vibrio splendidus TaxID=29497 RepID=A0AB35MYE6_VIBSP|nr:AbrB/MazE/SpoVT family DNA-binding domain-containing protein [Vibrio splendidus]MDP2501396.1 AbrB/MazE/SpoVT family DNA-binding domain-containing protein [Vibrio splendidus]PMM77681.1 hypothetical protein BCT47_14095 [Vibrio splendidus]PMO00197.1 hypothetical protein BCT19_23375 [Vibrio splendidus]
MEKKLIKIGNSTGLTIPSQWLSEMNLSTGSKVTLAYECGGITVKASNVKTKPNLEDLMANTDFEAQRNDPYLQAWANKQKNGSENT